MLAKVHAAAVVGLEGEIMEVEVDTTRGMPSFTIVGLPDTAVQESRERVQVAIKNAGLIFPRHRVTVNLAPADLRKEGPAYDLPIALGVLAASEQIRSEWLAGAMAVGELSGWLRSPYAGGASHGRACSTGRHEADVCACKRFGGGFIGS